MKRLLSLILILPAIAYGAGYLGALHPFFDSMSVFSLPLFWLTFAAACLLAWLRSRLTFVAIAILALSVMRLDTGQVAGQTDYSLYQKNIWYGIIDPAPLIADIEASGADFVTLQEVVTAQKPVVATLSRTFTSAHHCKISTDGGVAVLSRWPMIEGSAGCASNIGAAYMRVMTDDGPVWAISLHHVWPWPLSQAPQAARILEALEKLDGPKVMAGDFNHVPWSWQLQQYERRLGLHLMAWTNSFYLDNKLWIPIDHVLTPIKTDRDAVSTRPFLGSDHLGLLVQFNVK